MSELKVHNINDLSIHDIANRDFYFKSEADKVIEELESKLHNVSGIIKETREWLIESQKLHKKCADNAVKLISRQKYRRCLAKAQEWRNYAAFCGMQSYCHNHRGFGKTAEKWTWKECHAWRCFKSWLKIAERFEEAK